MTINILIGVLFFSTVFLCWLLYLKPHKRRSDSLLKKRAIFTNNQQLTFQRLKAILTDYSILAHVSFDVLLTTKFPHTRFKYRNMLADFVVLGTQNEILAIILVDDCFREKDEIDYQEQILKLAGYKVYHFDCVPSSQQILEAF